MVKTNQYLSGMAPLSATRSYRFNVTATDGDMSVSQVLTLFTNRKPEMIQTFESTHSTTNGMIQVICGQQFQMDLAEYFSDADGDAITITVARQNGTQMPIWLGINSNIAFGMPEDSDSEILNLLVNVTDAYGGLLQVAMTYYVNSAPAEIRTVPSKFYLTK